MARNRLRVSFDVIKLLVYHARETVDMCVIAIRSDCEPLSHEQDFDFSLYITAVRYHLCLFNRRVHLCLYHRSPGCHQ